MPHPYYQDESVTLYHGDWRELIPADFTADLIVADPPYGETSLEWDRWPDGWPKLAARHARSMWCYGSMRMFLDRRDEFTDWRLSQDVVWEKNRGTGFATDRFSRVHEHALHWYQGSWSEVYHSSPRQDSEAPNRGRAVLSRGTMRHAGELASRGWEDDGTRLKRSVIFARNRQGRAINETEKPVSHLEHLIDYACPTGGLVIDLYSGSSAALVAARNLGRRSVGFEKRESQCEKAALRLSQQVLDFGEVTA